MSSTSRRIASSISVAAFVFIAVALQWPAPRAPILVALLVAIVAESFVQRSSELGLAFARRDLDERQEAQRAQLLASTYRTTLALGLAGLVLFALSGEALLWQAGRRGTSFEPAMASNAVKWTIGVTLLTLTLLPGHVAAWQASRRQVRGLREGEVQGERA